MPGYNAGRYAGEAIESVLAQTFHDFELIIIDDCSTDNTALIASEYAARDQRVKLLKMPENSGGAYAPRLLGTRNALAERVCYIDIDDYIEPEFLEKLMAKASENPDAELIIPSMARYDGKVSGNVALPDERFFERNFSEGRELVKETLDGWTINLNGTLYLREKLLDAYAGFAEYASEANFYLDEVLSRRVLYEAGKTVFSRAVYHYRENPESVTRRHGPGTFSFLKRNRLICRLIMEDFGKDSDEYSRACHQEFRGFFDALRILDRDEWSREERACAIGQLSELRAQIDLKGAGSYASPVYKLLFRLPISAARRILFLVDSHYHPTKPTFHKKRHQ